MNRLVFITEEEARYVIRDEAAKAGLELAAPGRTIRNIRLPGTIQRTRSELARIKMGARHEPSKRPENLELDGANGKGSVSFEFVSMDDLRAWNVSTDTGTTVSIYDIVGTARTLRARLMKGAPPGTYAVFYDPVPSYIPSASEESAGVLVPETRVPVRALSMLRNVTVYQDTLDTARLENGSRVVSFRAGSNMATVDGTMRVMPVSAVRRHATLYVPLLFAAQFFDSTVTWNSERRTVTTAACSATDGEEMFALCRTSGERSLLMDVDFGVGVGIGSAAYAPLDRDLDSSRTLDVSCEELRAQVRDFITWLRAQEAL